VNGKKLTEWLPLQCRLPSNGSTKSAIYGLVFQKHEGLWTSK